MNARMPVLFDRALRPEWIDYALERYLESETEAVLREDLRCWLKAKGYGEYTVNKTALQLQRVIGFRSPLSRPELVEAYGDLCKLAPDERNLIRLHLLMRANPFFRDCVSAIQRSFRNGSSCITMQELYERLQAVYGHRGMIPRRVRYVLQTLAQFGVLYNANRAWYASPDGVLMSLNVDPRV